MNVCMAEKRRRAVPTEDLPVPTASKTPIGPKFAPRSPLFREARTVLFLRHYADLDYDQIGAVLGIARGTVAATLNTAHTRLRAVLGEVKR